MKNLKLIFLGLGCMAALCLTSCLEDNDNDNTGLSKDDISRCYKAILGNYSGKLLFSATNPKDVYDVMDTLEVQWTVNADTVLLIKDFPATALVEQVRNTELREALQEQNPVKDISCYMVFTAFKDSYIQFALGPQKIDFPVFYKEATHTLSIYFWANGSSFGEKDTATGDMILRLIVGAAYLDNDSSYNYITDYSTDTATIPIYFTTTL